MNGGDKLVKGVNVTIDNEATVESTVNILVSDVVVTEGGSCAVVTAVGVISGSKLLSVIRFTTLAERLVIDTTSYDVIKDRVLDGVSVNTGDIVAVTMVIVSDGVLKFRVAVDDSDTGIVSSVDAVSGDVIDGRVVLLGDVSRVVTCVTESVSVDCVTVGTITLVILMTTGSDVAVTIVDKLSPVTTSVGSVNNTVGLVIG